MDDGTPRERRVYLYETISQETIVFLPYQLQRLALKQHNFIKEIPITSLGQYTQGIIDKKCYGQKRELIRKL